MNITFKMNITLEDGKVILDEEDFVKLLKCKTGDLVANVCCPKEKNLEKEVTEYLLNKGITRNLLGFNYLRKTVLMAIEKPEVLDKITVLYHLIAKEFNSTGQRTERAIRHAIESTGNKVVNSQFICDAVDEIKLMRGGDVG